MGEIVTRHNSEAGKKKYSEISLPDLIIHSNDMNDIVNEIHYYNQSQQLPS